jgi:HEAT repeat protein
MHSKTADPDFSERVRALVERAAPEHRTQIQQDVEAILAHVASPADLVALAVSEDTAAELSRVALWLLGVLGEKPAAGAIIGALGRPDPAIRAEAAKTLALLEIQDAIEPLVVVLREDPAQNVREAAAYALGLLGDPVAVPMLAEIAADTGETPVLRGMAIEALSDLNATQVAELLVEGLNDPSGEVRYWCAYALGRVGDKSAIPALRRRVDVDTEILEGRGTVATEAASAIREINSRL